MVQHAVRGQIGVHHQKVIFTVACLLLALSCSDPNVASRTPEYDVPTESPAQQWALSDRDLNALMNEAVQGDVRAAERVALHYEISTATPSDDVHWVQIAAENGSPMAMQHLAVILRQEGGQINCARALFWLGRALEMDISNEDRASLNLEETRNSIANDTENCS